MPPGTFSTWYQAKTGIFVPEVGPSQLTLEVVGS